MSAGEDFFIQSFSLLELALLQVTGCLKSTENQTIRVSMTLQEMKRSSYVSHFLQVLDISSPQIHKVITAIHKMI